jgi:hypothetical protein
LISRCFKKICEYLPSKQTNFNINCRPMYHTCVQEIQWQVCLWILPWLWADLAPSKRWVSCSGGKRLPGPKAIKLFTSVIYKTWLWARVFKSVLPSLKYFRERSWAYPKKGPITLASSQAFDFIGKTFQGQILYLMLNIHELPI